MEATLQAKSGLVKSGTAVFEKGKNGSGHFTIKASESESLPVDLLVVAPIATGTYPVILFCHGWKMATEDYSDLFDHIASHGNIIVAPQFYGRLWTITMAEEIKRASAVAAWIPIALEDALESNGYDDVNCDVDIKLVVAGHSRGAKIAFALASGETGIKVSSKKKKNKKTSPLPVKDVPAAAVQGFSAVIGIDPVGGTSPQDQEYPKILEYIPRCFKMSVPVAVVGTGYSNQSKMMGFPACAPDGVNHSEFFNESKPPVCYFLAREYGHFDMMNDSTFVGVLRKLVAVSGKEGTMDLMRRATGGLVAAFLRAYLSDEDDDLHSIVKDPTLAPVLLDPVLHIDDEE